MVAEVASALTVSHPPIKVFYYHYHNSIRSELADLSAAVTALEDAPSVNAAESLVRLKRRVAFLDQVYSIHSSVEDEVIHSHIYRPALMLDGIEYHFADFQAFWLVRTPVESAITLQVVYPALDLKVKNVTHAYSVEHEDEVCYCNAVPATSPGVY